MHNLTFTARDRLKLLLGGSAAVLSACGGGSSNTSTVPPTTATPPPPPPLPPMPVGFSPTPGQFKNTFATNFQIGAAIQDSQIGDTNVDAQILKDQFNSITAEFQMKPEIIAPIEGVFDWTVPDALVQFAEDNDMVIRGHTSGRD